MKQLEELCEFSSGLWKGKKPPFINIGVIRNTNFTKIGTLDDSNIEYLDVEIKQFEKRRLKYGDIILEKSGGGPKQPVGRVVLFEKKYGDFSFSNFTASLRVRDQNRINIHFLHKYLYWSYLSGVTEGMQQHSTGIRNLDLNAYKKINIYYPPLPEQQRIVAILDEAFDSIETAKANAEKNLANARELFDSYLNSVFSRKGEGWNIRQISHIAQHSLGKMLDKSKNKGELKPYLRNLNVRWFTFDLSDILQMPFQPHETEKYSAVKGDVLICEGGYPGRAAIWNEDHPIYFQKALHRVRFHEPAYSKWLVYYLYSQDKSGELKRHFSGTGIMHFTGETLAKFELPLPPLSELQQLLEHIDKLFTETQRLESIYRRKIEALDELKQSILHQAFSGEL